MDNLTAIHYMRCCTELNAKQIQIMGMNRPPNGKENDFLMIITICFMLVGLALFFLKLVSITM